MTKYFASGERNDEVENGHYKYEAQRAVSSYAHIYIYKQDAYHAFTRATSGLGLIIFAHYVFLKLMIDVKNLILKRKVTTHLRCLRRRARAAKKICAAPTGAWFKKRMQAVTIR